MHFLGLSQGARGRGANDGSKLALPVEEKAILETIRSSHQVQQRALRVVHLVHSAKLQARRHAANRWGRESGQAKTEHSDVAPELGR